MEEYYGNNDWRDYLAHHGILGQKWGHRNGPPYPLDGSDHSVSEKKAGWRKSLSGGSGGGGTVKKKRTSSSASSAKSNSKLVKSKDAAKATYKAQKKAIKEQYSKESDRYFRKAINANSPLEDRSIAETKMLRAGLKKTKSLQDAKNQYRRSIGKKEKDYTGTNSVSQKLKINNTDTKQTKAVKRDYNSLSDKDFFRLYGVTKKTYKKRVDKYGDPYKYALSKYEQGRSKKKK